MRLPVFASVLACAALFSAVRHASAQQITLKKGDIPRIPTDTLPTDRDQVRVVTFSDGTFRYIPADPYLFLSAPAYGTHWDTLRLFAYRDTELSHLPERVAIELSDSHGYRAPVTGRVLSQYGRRSGRDHNGTDIGVAHGQPIFATFDGIVRHSRWNSGGYGNLIIIRHPNGLETWYGHLSRRAASAGEWVRAGQIIGYGGRTGRASANHLHFETRYYDQSFDPERLIDFATGELCGPVFTLRREYFNIRSRASEEIDEDPAGLFASTVVPGSEAAPLSADASGADPAAVASEHPESDASEPLYHKIVSGDTLLALALRYGTTVAKICNLNGITRKTTLRPGRTLRIK